MPNAIHCTVHLFAFHFLYNKVKTCPTFPWQVKDYVGKYLVKLQAIAHRNKWLSVSFMNVNENILNFYRYMRFREI